MLMKLNLEVLQAPVGGPVVDPEHAGLHIPSDLVWVSFTFFNRQTGADWFAPPTINRLETEVSWRTNGGTRWGNGIDARGV